MAKFTAKDTPIYYRERLVPVRKWRFCLQSVNTMATKEEKRTGNINIVVNNRNISKQHCLQVEKEEEKKIHQHLDYVVKKLQKIHKSLIWNIYVGRSFVNKIPANSSLCEERNLESSEEREFDPNNGNSWSGESLEHVQSSLAAAEITADGIVSLYCVKSDPEIDADDVAWTIQKVLINQCVQTDLHRCINQEAVMTRQGLHPTSRKVKTPGRGHNGYLVYLAYQLVESVTYSQIMGETLLYSSDIKAKKKYLAHHIGDLRFPPVVEEKVRKQTDQIKDWLSRDQTEVLMQIQQIKDKDEIKVVTQLLQLLQAGNRKQSGSALGLSDFISFLSQQGNFSNSSQENGMRRSISRQSIVSVTSTTNNNNNNMSKPGMETANRRKSSVSSLSTFSSCSSTPETNRRISTSSQDSPGVGGRPSLIQARKHHHTHLADIQSDSDSLSSTPDTLVDKSEGTARTRRETQSRRPKSGGRPVRRVASARESMNGAGGGGADPKLKRSFSDRKLKTLGDSEQSSKASPRLNSLAEHVTEQVTEHVTEHVTTQQEVTSCDPEPEMCPIAVLPDVTQQLPESQNPRGGFFGSDDRLVAASVKLSRQVKRTSSVNSPKLNSPKLIRSNSATPKSRRM